MTASHKIKRATTVCLHLGHLSQRTEDLCPHKTLDTKVQSNFSHNSPKLETTQMLFSG